MMKNIVLSTAVIALLTCSAHSQSIQQRQQERGGKVEKTPLQMEEEERARRAMDVERDYEAAMKRSSGGKPSAAPADPWQTVRPKSGPSGDAKK